MTWEELIEAIKNTGAMYIATDGGTWENIIIFDVSNYAMFVTCQGIGVEYSTTSGKALLGLSYTGSISKMSFEI
jgi:hypothetical protein